MNQSFDSLRQLEINVTTPVRIYHNREEDEYPPHWHYSYEIIMPVVGRFEVVVDHAGYELLPGEVFVIPSGVVHELNPLEPGERYIFMVDQDMVLNIEGLPPIRGTFYPCAHLRFDRDPETLRQVSDVLWAAVREQEEDRPMRKAAIRAWLTVALVRLGRWLAESRQANRAERRHSMNATMLEVYAYVAAHCSEKLTLEDIAARSGYSKYHFARVFREYAGVSFYEFYMRQRMLLCTRLLTEQSIPVTEVALRAGFGSIATFNRIFKRYQGMTPSEYRRLGRDTDEPAGA